MVTGPVSKLIQKPANFKDAFRDSLMGMPRATDSATKTAIRTNSMNINTIEFSQNLGLIFKTSFILFQESIARGIQKVESFFKNNVRNLL